MRRASILLASLVVSLGLAAPATAQVFVRTPGVRVVVDPGPPPPRPVYVVPAPVVVAPAPPPVVVTPAPPPVVVTPAPTVVLTRPQTPAEFARSFQPCAGKYEATLLHPRTGLPVRVDFTLPAGAPVVRVHPYAVVFEYSHHHDVEIRFGIGGHARVIYRE